MIFSRATAIFALALGVSAQSQYTATGTAAVAAAAATALTLSPTSNVTGSTFDRFVQIWLENHDYLAAILNREYPMLWDSLNITHVNGSDSSKSCLSGLSRHYALKLSCHYSPLSGMMMKDW
jgi:hypothetical protein